MTTEVDTEIHAAGAVCWRFIDGSLHILVIHRTQYGDVTIPKGKVDPGESLPQTAVREIKEETGLSIQLGVPLGVSRYQLRNGREKVVHYWAAEVREQAIQQSTFRPNSEVAAIEWVTPKRARNYLSYVPDKEILANFEQLVEQRVTETFAITLVRHGKAVSRSDWDGTDATRPLTERGIKQAAGLTKTLSAWQPKRIISSSAIRCTLTVTPFSAASGIPLKRDDRISQEAWDRGEADVRQVVGKRVRVGKSAIICSHGPLFPDILREIALATGTPAGSYIADAAALDTGAFSVVHLSATNPASGIIAIETHPPRA